MENVNVSELKVGEFITVVRHRNGTDRSFIGEIMRVLAVDDPFVAVRHWWKYSNRGPTVTTLSAGEWVLKRISDAYVRAVLTDDEQVTEGLKTADSQPAPEAVA